MYQVNMDAYRNARSGQPAPTPSGSASAPPMPPPHGSASSLPMSPRRMPMRGMAQSVMGAARRPDFAEVYQPTNNQGVYQAGGNAPSPMPQMTSEQWRQQMMAQYRARAAQEQQQSALNQARGQVGQTMNNEGNYALGGFMYG